MSRVTRGVVILLSLLSVFALSTAVSRGASGRIFSEWSASGVKPGGGIWFYSGNYSGRTDWNPLRQANVLTLHESMVWVRNPTGDIRWPGTVLYFIHDGQVRRTVPAYAWSSVGCGVIAPGGAVFGGCTTAAQYLGAFDPLRRAQDRGTWSFMLCDAAGCYGGVSRDRTWNLW